MCGIFGVVHKAENEEIICADLFKRAAQFIRQRGPDAFQIDVSDGYAFAHARLNIIDDDPRSNQPMRDVDSRFILVFNGEIYNYQEIKLELKGFGIRFSTESDTEVLLQALIFWGESALQKLNGIFAFAFFDKLMGSLWLARDPIGVKPLFFYIDEREILFSSLPYSILSYKKINTDVSFESIISFLSFRTTLGDKHFVDGIKKLLPGQLLIYKQNNFFIKKYFNLYDLIGHEKSTFDRKIITQAVKRQMNSLKSSATLLSGGVDSSILSYEISKHSSYEQKCFVGKFSMDQYDESFQAEVAARHIGCILDEVDINAIPDTEAINELILLRQAPLGMHNEIGMYGLSKKISTQYKVVFCGEGADEIFGGYGRIFRLPFDWKRAHWINKIPVKINKIKSNLEIDNFDLNNFTSCFLSRYRYFPIDLIKSILKTEFHNDLVHCEDSQNIFFNDLLSDVSSSGQVDKISYLFLSFHLPALLEMLDGVTMASGIEARVPFTDIEVIKMGLGMPETEKICWRSTIDMLEACFKPISKFSEDADIPKCGLKNGYKNLLPSEILYRKKMGFPAPLGLWAISDCINDVKEEIFSSRAIINKWFDGEKIKHWYCSQARLGNDTFGRQFWLLINLELFLNQLPKISRDLK